jgi:hypothetical protein
MWIGVVVRDSIFMRRNCMLVLSFSSVQLHIQRVGWTRAVVMYGVSLKYTLALRLRETVESRDTKVLF